mgnify:CR=1 FL=1
MQFRFQCVAIFLFSFFFFTDKQCVFDRSNNLKTDYFPLSRSMKIFTKRGTLSNRSFTAYVANIRLFFHIFFISSTKACRLVQYLLHVFSLATGNFSFFLLFSFLFFFLFFDRPNQLQRRDFGKVSAVERSRDSRRRVVGPAKLSAYFVSFVNDSAERLRVCVKIKTKETKQKTRRARFSRRLFHSASSLFQFAGFRFEYRWRFTILEIDLYAIIAKFVSSAKN